MSVKDTLKLQFPQITISTDEAQLTSDKSMVTYSCAYHGGGRTETLKKLKARSFSCPKCASLLNKGHAFNLNGLPLQAKKIQEVKSFFGEKFDYSKFMATDTFTPGTIKCSTHGEFKISLIDHVMMKEQAGCPDCLADLEGRGFTPNSKPATEAELLTSSLEVAKTKRTCNRKLSQMSATVTSDWLQDAKKLFKAVA